MKVLSWNYRGLGSKSKEESMMDLVSLHQPDIFLIQETKMEEAAFLHVSFKFWKKRGKATVSSRGASGGIGTLWDDKKFEAVDIKYSSCWILTLLRQKDTNTLVRIFNIYAPNSYAEKKVCWRLLREEKSNLQGNVILAGDLNVTLSQEEKRGGTLVRDPIRETVDEIILDWDLMDVKPSSGKYTWNNKRIGPRHIAARLDRFLVQDTFLLLGLNLSSKILPFGGSNHKPVLLEMANDKNLGPIPFRFNPLWARQPEFLKIVADTWSLPVTGSPSYIWEEKLRRLKRALKSWAKSIPSPTLKKSLAVHALEEHQTSMEEKIVAQKDIDIEAILQSNLHTACRLESD